MKILAWINLTLLGISIILTPLLFEKDRPPYDYTSWLNTCCAAALMVPLIGRILGWW